MSLRYQSRPHLPVQAVGFGCSGAMLFTLQDAAFKWFSADYAVWQIIFLRCFLALLISTLWVWKYGGTAALRVRHPRLFACSLVANVTAWYCFYSGLSQLPLTLAICVFFLTPVITATAAVPLLGETLTWRQVVALLGGFIGVVVIVNPLAETAPVSLPAVGLVLVSVLMWSAMALLTRALESSITVGATLLYNNIAFMSVAALFQPAVWQAPTQSALLGMVLLGGLGVAAQACVFTAYRSARAAVAATTEYTALVWAALLGWLLWEEHFTLRTGIGAAIIIGAGLMVMYSRRKRTG